MRQKTLRIHPPHISSRPIEEAIAHIRSKAIRNERDVIYGFRSVLASQGDADKIDNR
jgi:hypothetical protein